MSEKKRKVEWDPEAALEVVSAMTEVYSGVRNALIREGFTPEIAEALIIEQMRNDTATTELETAKARMGPLSGLFGRMGGE